MLKLLSQYALAGLLGVLSVAGTIVSDDLVMHHEVDWPVVLGESIRAVLPLIPALAVAMHLNDLGTAKAAAHIKARMRADDAVAIPGGPR
jgi:MFS superfamily sulfate permease-like transporter